MGSNLVTIVRNFAISVETFGPDDHDVQDGCVTPGQHRVMRFDFLSHNVGDTDAVVGSPADRPDLFVRSAGHGHYHLKDFNEFKLFDTSGQQVQIGHKQAFCLIDVERIHPNARPDAQFNDCNANQGISAGWADLYNAGLACQYIVIDGVADGNYTLQSITNSLSVVHEDCYSDNTMWSGLQIHGNNVTEIPLPWGPEDRISLNPNNVAAIQVNSRWKVADGNHWILDFDQKRTAAEHAVSVIKHYELSYICFVGRPACSGQQPMTYWLTVDGNSPAGPMTSEDAIGFDPSNLLVIKIDQSWKIADGSHWLLDFGPGEGNAKLALYFIKKYGFTKICFVGRPDPPMLYFRNDTEPVAPQGPSAQGDDMQPGEVLNPNQSITSANGRYSFIYQGDGNLVLYDGGRPLWASNTDGRPVGVCIMQGDGNLVIYGPGGGPIWASNTDGNNGSRLVVQDDGNVVIYRPDGTPAWATNTWLPQGPSAQGDDMQPGEVLNPNQSITSANGRYSFIYQGDGNLVLYDGGRPLWASNTDGRPVGVCIMQGDGNLVIYGPGGGPIWASNTDGNNGSRLVVQDDGNVVIYRPDGTPAWATNTVQS